MTNAYYIKQSFINLEQGNKDLALWNAHQAVGLDQNNALALATRGVAFLAKDFFAESYQDFTSSIQISSSPLCPFYRQQISGYIGMSHELFGFFGGALYFYYRSGMLNHAANLLEKVRCIPITLNSGGGDFHSMLLDLRSRQGADAEDFTFDAEDKGTLDLTNDGDFWVSSQACESSHYAYVYKTLLSFLILEREWTNIQALDNLKPFSENPALRYVFALSGLTPNKVSALGAALDAFIINYKEVKEKNLLPQFFQEAFKASDGNNIFAKIGTLVDFALSTLS